jgi:hypothetical protein
MEKKAIGRTAAGDTLNLDVVVQVSLRRFSESLRHATQPDCWRILTFSTNW